MYDTVCDCNCDTQVLRCTVLHVLMMAIHSSVKYETMNCDMIKYMSKW
jgi:hypothetical protein